MKPEHMNDPYVIQLIEALAKRDDEIERLTELLRLPYPPNDGKTHWEGCWKDRGHHNCAVAKVEQLEGALAESCDENRSHVLAEGPWSTDMCPIAGKLSARVAQLEGALRDAPKPSKSASHPGWYGLPEREEYVYWYVNPRSKALASEANKGSE